MEDCPFLDDEGLGVQVADQGGFAAQENVLRYDQAAFHVTMNDRGLGFYGRSHDTAGLADLDPFGGFHVAVHGAVYPDIALYVHRAVHFSTFGYDRHTALPVSSCA